MGSGASWDFSGGFNRFRIGFLAEQGDGVFAGARCVVLIGVESGLMYVWNAVLASSRCRVLVLESRAVLGA